MIGFWATPDVMAASATALGMAEMSLGSNGEGMMYSGP